VGNFGPVVLAWSNLRHKPGGLLRPLLMLGLCLLLLFTQIGLFEAALELPARLTQDESSTREKAEDTRSVARGFLVGVIGAFLLSLLVILDLLLSEVDTHALDFAMLAALGYSPLYLRGIVVAECFLAMLLAFVPAALLMPCAYAIVRAWTGLAVTISMAHLAVALGLAFLLAALSGLVALLKQKTSPRENLFL
jgi:ABC-type antimicrobial peptide transport system permease subunit